MTVVTGPFNRRDAPGGLSEAVLSAALCGSMERYLAGPGHRVSGDTNAPMPSRPRDSDALIARDGPARSPWAPRSSGSRAGPRRVQATNVRVI